MLKDKSSSTHPALVIIGEENIQAFLRIKPKPVTPELQARMENFKAMCRSEYDEERHRIAAEFIRIGVNKSIVIDIMNLTEADIQWVQWDLEKSK